MQIPPYPTSIVRTAHMIRWLRKKCKVRTKEQIAASDKMKLKFDATQKVNELECTITSLSARIAPLNDALNKQVARCDEEAATDIAKQIEDLEARIHTCRRDIEALNKAQRGVDCQHSKTIVRDLNRMARRNELADYDKSDPSEQLMETQELVLMREKESVIEEMQSESMENGTEGTAVTLGARGEWLLRVAQEQHAMSTKDMMHQAPHRNQSAPAKAIVIAEDDEDDDLARRLAELRK